MNTPPTTSTQKRSPRKPIPGGKRTLNFSLSSDEERWIRETAEMNHGGNVSHLMRYLIRIGRTLDEQRRTAA